MRQRRFPPRRPNGRPRPLPSLPYRRRGPLLSKGEAAFFRTLKAAVGRHYHVAFKARLADLITCDDAAWKDGFGHMIARHHIDFVICDYRSLEVLAAIELDDKSHEKASRRRRDRFLDDALRVAGVPLLRVKAAARYDRTAIAELVENVIPGDASISNQAASSKSRCNETSSSKGLTGRRFNQTAPFGTSS